MDYLKKALKSKGTPNLLLYGLNIDEINQNLIEVLDGSFVVLDKKSVKYKDIIYHKNNIYYEFTMISIKKNVDTFIEILNELIISKNYFSINSHKIVILNQFNNIKSQIQNILRVIIEKYRLTTVFIIITNKYSSVIGPLKSRCLCIRFPIIKDKDKRQIMYKKVNLDKINTDMFDNVYKLRGIHLINEYLKVDYDKVKEFKFPSEIVCDNIIQICRKNKYNKNIHNKLRALAYNILKFNIDINNIYYVLCVNIIDENIIDKHKYAIVKLLSESQYNYNKCYRRIIVLESLFCNLFKLL